MPHRFGEGHDVVDAAVVAARLAVRVAARRGVATRVANATHQTLPLRHLGGQIADKHKK
jgi:hypothetical protein